MSETEQSLLDARDVALRAHEEALALGTDRDIQMAYVALTERIRNLRDYQAAVLAAESAKTTGDEDEPEGAELIVLPAQAIPIDSTAVALPEAS